LNTASILAQIDAEILKLQEAKALLNGAVSKKGPGRPKKSVAVAVAAPAKAKTAKRVLSPEAKARIAAAQQARWAKVRRAAKKAAKAEAAAWTMNPGTAGVFCFT
jgi:hypothetical protein